MKTFVLGGLLSFTLAATAFAAPPLKPELAGLGFLVGDWSSGKGVVAETGGTSTGGSRIEAMAGGAVLLRRDHTELFDKAGKPAGGFEQVMTVYAEGGSLHADYFDGAHVIHYASATVDPGRAVAFISAAQPGAPTFRLSYRLADPSTLEVNFAMAPPGGADFHPIAAGTLKRGG